MHPLGDQNFYELLEVSPESSLEEIARAYQIVRSTYETSSLATYSIFSDEEAQDIRRRVEEAYAVLSDAGLRREYDGRLGQRQLAARSPEPVPQRRASHAAELARDPYVARSPRMDLELEESLEPADGVFDGPVLRRIRLSRGVELEEISATTKINQTYLGFIEEERFNDLPAPVYVRGFLREYARCLRLDPRRVTESYMEQYQDRIRGRR